MMATSHHLSNIRRAVAATRLPGRVQSSYFDFQKSIYLLSLGKNKVGLIKDQAKITWTYG